MRSGTLLNDAELNETSDEADPPQTSSVRRLHSWQEVTGQRALLQSLPRLATSCEMKVGAIPSMVVQTGNPDTGVVEFPCNHVLSVPAVC